MRAKSGTGGFSLLEVVISLSLLATGAMVGLGLMATSAARGEITREQAIAYKACQDVMEAHLSMDKLTLLAQKTWQQGLGGPAPFSVNSLKNADGSSPQGSFVLQDITSRIDPAAPADSLIEIRVRFKWRGVDVQLCNWRYVP
jgi:type II secretory pathway pseudopilin PulG